MVAEKIIFYCFAFYLTTILAPSVWVLRISKRVDILAPVLK